MITLTRCAYLLVFLASNTLSPTQAYAAHRHSPEVASEAPSVSAGIRTIEPTFKDLGQASPFDLRGLQNDGTVNFGVRLDESVRKARLHLVFSYSPALIAQLSHLKVYLNDEVVAYVPLPAQKLSADISQDIDIDPRFFTDYNHLRIQLIGHYTYGCEDPNHSSLWATISNRSSLNMTLSPLALVNDLSLLPAPFFDRRDSRRLSLPFVFAAKPDIKTLRAGGIAASWFGMQASYRGARFPVSLGVLPAHSAVIMVRNGETIAGLKLAPAHAPTLQVISAKDRPAIKYLIIQGRDGHDIEMAATAMALGKVVMTGASASISKVDLGAPRLPYDAPNWIRTDRALKFGELVASQADLQRTLENRDPIHIRMRIPPDLFTWRIHDINIDMRYRYTPPSRHDNSQLSVYLNDQFVQSFNLQPGNGRGGNALKLPLLDEASILARDKIAAPPFYVGVANELQIRYLPEINREGLCNTSLQNGYTVSVDPDSTIDLSKFPHYIAMPNLSAFANGGFPFTKYADLAKTSVILPTMANADDISVMLTLLGHLSAETGYPATRYNLFFAQNLKRAESDDILLIGTASSQPALRAWEKDLPLMIDGVKHVLRSTNNIFSRSYNWLSREGDPEAIDDISASINANGDLGALIGFESPLNDKSSVISITANQQGAMLSVLDALDQNAIRFHGDVTLVRNQQVDSFQVGELYHLGKLPFWSRLWLIFSEHPLLLAIASIAVGLLFAILMFFGLNYLAKKRLVKR